MTRLMVIGAHAADFVWRAGGVIAVTTANEGVAQVIFFESDEVCETSYKDRGGKYQGQQGVTLPKT